MLSIVLAVIWVTVALTALLLGLDYYVLPVESRAYSPLAPVFAPTGTIGHGLGVLGTAMILVGVVGYGLRKRVRWLGRFGALRSWLQVHIFLCTLGPFLVLLHTTFKFGGIVSIAFWSMVVVVVSGIFGRYVYVRIPKTVNGRFLAVGAVRARTAELTARLGEVTGLTVREIEAMFGSTGPVVPSSLGGALVFALREDVRSRLTRRRARQFLRTSGIPSELHAEVLTLARENARTLQQAVLLRPFQRLFGYWHVFHLPLAILMFVILGIHIAVAILFGYGWVF